MFGAVVNPQFFDALDRARDLAATASNISKIAGATSPEAARWAFTQWDLRSRAAAKFALAEKMLFDRDGLEMASHERLAGYHAAQFPEGERIVEIGCGIGSDTIALAKRGPVVAFEPNPVRAELAAHNLRVHGLDAEIRVEPWIPGVSARFAFADPSRRTGGRRSVEPGDFSPDPGSIVEGLHGAEMLGIKLSPMVSDAYFERFEARIEFASLGRECREALMWFGRGGGTFAVHVESGELLPSCEPCASLDEPLPWVFEADPAAVRAHALGAFGLAGLGDSNGYLTGMGPASSPWLRGFHVLEHGRFDEKLLRTALARNGGRTPEIKQRGTGIDPGRLRKQLQGRGDRSLTVLLYPVGKSIRFVLAIE